EEVVRLNIMFALNQLQVGPMTSFGRRTHRIHVDASPTERGKVLALYHAHEKRDMPKPPLSEFTARARAVGHCCGVLARTRHHVSLRSPGRRGNGKLGARYANVLRLPLWFRRGPCAGEIPGRPFRRRRARRNPTTRRALR